MPIKKLQKLKEVEIRGYRNLDKINGNVPYQEKQMVNIM